MILTAHHITLCRQMSCRLFYFCLLSTCFGFITPSLVNATELNFKPCSLTGSGGNGNLNALCATFQQPLDHQQPDGPQLDLQVVKIPSTAIEPATDAFTIINGGPGGSSIDLLVDLGGLIQTFTRERDVIVVDQRGTGRSAPLTCPDIVDSADEPSLEETVALTQQCLDALPFDPTFFTTTVAVNDLETLRLTLGYDQLSIYGVSYGTRVAQQFARQYPNSTRAIVIDGVVPADEVLGKQIAIHSNDALLSVFARCEASPPCTEAFPDLRQDFAELSHTLKTQPPILTIQDPVTDEPTELTLTYGHMAAWLRFALYSPEMTSLIPLIINQAAQQQRYVPVAANAIALINNITTALNYGMHNAVLCTEDAPYFSHTTQELEQLEQTYIGAEMYQTIEAMCSIWPKGTMHADMKVPLETDIPTLVLSGEHDPITPSSWGDAVMPGLSFAKHIVVPHQGHGTIARGCVPKLILEFIEQGDPTTIDDSCTQFIHEQPFFINNMGPLP